MQDWVWTVEKVIMLIGGPAVIGAVLKEAYRLYMKSLNDNYEEVTRKVSAIHQEMRKIIRETKASKVVILRLHNGGDKVQVGKPLMSSTIHEVGESTMLDAQGVWENQRVDEGYIKKFIEMLKAPDRTIEIYTKDLPTEGLLKDIYEANGVKKAVATHIHTFKPRPFKLFQGLKSEDKGKMWYMLVHWDNDVTITPGQRYIIRGAKNTIRDIFKEQYKYD